jgi:hypothetical protein
METRLIREDPTPPRREGELWVERMKGAQCKEFTVYSSKIWGVWTHWSGSRTVPCFVDRSRCPSCLTKCPQRWKGYLHCYDHRGRRPVFLELTPTAARGLLSFVGEGVDLRGLRVTCKRTSSDRGRLLIAVDGSVAVTDRLAVPVDPYEAVMALLGFPVGGDAIALSFADRPEDVERRATG